VQIHYQFNNRESLYSSNLVKPVYSKENKKRMSGEIKVSKDGPIATVTISRPKKLNSVTHDMLKSFEDDVSLLTNDPDVRAIIFTGEGEKAFTAGFDMETVMGLRGQDAYDFFKLMESAIRQIREAKNCITVAAVNGYAIGFGAIVACASDFRFFAENGLFRLPEVDLGILPGGGASSNLLHLVGPARAKDILLTTRKVAADEALGIGLADRVFPIDELLPKTREFVEEILSRDCTIVLMTKTLVDAMTGKEVPEAMELETAYLEEWLRKFAPKE
jgi:enoyl-CoA hydratase/carnithine racemase